MNKLSMIKNNSKNINEAWVWGNTFDFLGSDNFLQTNI